jgi:hypothetical protein
MMVYDEMKAIDFVFLYLLASTRLVYDMNQAEHIYSSMELIIIIIFKNKYKSIIFIII